MCCNYSEREFLSGYHNTVLYCFVFLKMQKTCSLSRHGKIRFCFIQNDAKSSEVISINLFITK